MNDAAMEFFTDAMREFVGRVQPANSDLAGCTRPTDGNRAYLGPGGR